MATGKQIFAIMGWGAENSKILPAFCSGIWLYGDHQSADADQYAGSAESRLYYDGESKRTLQRSIIWKHAVRNAIMPVITIMGPLVAAVLMGSFVVENIFSIPGMGLYFVQSVQQNDYPMVAGLTMFMARS